MLSVGRGASLSIRHTTNCTSAMLLSVCASSTIRAIEYIHWHPPTFGGTSIKIVVVRDGKSSRGDVSTRRFSDFRGADRPACELVEKRAAQFPTLPASASACPASSTVELIVHSLTNVKGWVEVPLCQLLPKKPACRRPSRTTSMHDLPARWKYGAALGAQSHHLHHARHRRRRRVVLERAASILGAGFAAGRDRACQHRYLGRPGP